MSETKAHKKAAALRYEAGLPAPFITAKGKDRLAEKILEIAEEHGVEIVENKDLAERLLWFDVGSFIPEELYAIVAEILAFVYAVEKRSYENV